MKKQFLKEMKEYIVFLLVIIVIQTQVVAQSLIPSSSMVPTISVNDRLLINRLATKYKAPNRGDIVVFLKEKKFPLNEYWIKRVVAMPNEVVDIQNDKVYIDGIPLEEDYTVGTTEAFGFGITFPYTVPQGHYFVLGDNRENSYDSRGLGAIGEKDITAIGAYKIYPFNDMGVLE